MLNKPTLTSNDVIRTSDAKSRATIKRLKFELKECRVQLQKELNRGYANGYNDAMRAFTNKLRELVGVDAL